MILIHFSPKMLQKKVIKTKSKYLLIIDESKDEPMPENNFCNLEEKTLAKIAFVVCLILTLLLLINMTDDWALDPDKNQKVFVIAAVFFCFNILICCYICKNVWPTPRVHEVNLSYGYSVNAASEPLLSRDSPPSYEAVSECRVNIPDPPSYDEARKKIETTDPEQDQPKATG